MKFPFSTCLDTDCGAPVYLYKFDKRIENTECFQDKNYVKIACGSKGNVFAFVYNKIKTASGGAKGLLKLASPVHKDSILPKTARRR